MTTNLRGISEAFLFLSPRSVGLLGQLCVGLQIGIRSTPHFSHFPWTRRCPGQFFSWWTTGHEAKPNYRNTFKVSAHPMSTNIFHWPKQVRCQVQHQWMGKYTLIPPVGGTIEQHGKDWMHSKGVGGEKNWSNLILSPILSILILPSSFMKKENYLKRSFQGFLQKVSESFFQKLPGLVRFHSKFMLPDSED